MAVVATHRVGTRAKPNAADRAVLDWTGAFGIGAAVLLMATAPLYASMGQPPSLADEQAFAAFLAQHQFAAITTKLIDGTYVLAFIVFAAGLRHLVRQSDADREWAASLTFGLGLVFGTIVVVGDVLGAAAALDASSAPNAAAARALSEAALPAFGAFSLMATAAFLCAAGYSILASRAFPGWLGWTALATAVVNLAAAPTIYGGGDFLATTIAGSGSAGLYSYATVVAGAVFTVWLACAGAAMIWRGRRPFAR